MSNRQQHYYYNIIIAFLMFCHVLIQCSSTTVGVNNISVVIMDVQDMLPVAAASLGSCNTVSTCKILFCLFVHLRFDSYSICPRNFVKFPCPPTITNINCSTPSSLRVISLSIPLNFITIQRYNYIHVTFLNR